ncbi:MAG TPA: 50S ribosomal protein L29 [Candidatus Acidoferrales bacterium]|nr:50S ribosomal protein L29 [Candidatus Acidoferrales bacterium]
MGNRMEEFRPMNRNELEIQAHELGEQIFRLRFQLTTGQSESVKKLREARRDLARVKTLVRQQELGIQPSAPKEKSEGQAKKLKAASDDKRSHRKHDAKEKDSKKRGARESKEAKDSKE